MVILGVRVDEQENTSIREAVHWREVSSGT